MIPLPRRLQVLLQSLIVLVRSSFLRLVYLNRSILLLLVPLSFSSFMRWSLEGVFWSGAFKYFNLLGPLLSEELVILLSVEHWLCFGNLVLNSAAVHLRLSVLALVSCLLLLCSNGEFPLTLKISFRAGELFGTSERLLADRIQVHTLFCQLIVLLSSIWQLSSMFGVYLLTSRAMISLILDLVLLHLLYVKFLLIELMMMLLLAS